MTEKIESVFEKQKPVIDRRQENVPSYPFLVWKSQEEFNRLEEILECLRQSKTGRRLIDDAEKHQTSIRLDAGMKAYGSYDEVTNNLKINANSDLNRQVGTMAHELRHAQQFQKGILMDAYLDTPKSYIQNQSVIEADASATAAAVCYELALSGNDRPLESLREKDAHIVNPFQNQAVKGGLADGSAYRAAFKGWFSDYSTRDCYDILYIKMVRQRFRNCTREEEDKKFERDVPVNDVVQKVCVCGGKTYLSEKDTREFFNTQDACSVSFERFNNIYANCYRKFNFDWNKPQEEVMKEKLGLYCRPHSMYMPAKVVPEPLPIPDIAVRQGKAAEKIAAAKKEKNTEKTVETALPALLKKKRSLGK